MPIENNIHHHRKEQNPQVLCATAITISALKQILLSEKNLQKNLGKLKGDAAADDDKWHDETFRLIEEQGRINEARMHLLYPGLNTKVLEKAQIIEPNKTDEIGLGSKVSAIENGVPAEFIIVSHLDSIVNPLKDSRWISNESPIGKALEGKKTDEEIEVQTPGGKTTLKILAVAPATEIVPQSEQAR